MLWAVLGIVQTALSCGVNLLFGALGAAYAFVGRGAWARGEYDAAMGHLRTAKIFNIIGFAVFALLVAAVVLYRILTGSGASVSPFR